MRPNTSVRQPIIAGVRGRQLSDLLRAWHSQPRQRSSGLFWSLIALAFAVDTALLFVTVYLLGIVDRTPTSPPSERRMHVPHARNAALWEPLRHWVVRIEGQPRIFESFCREAVRGITGSERFEDNDPLPVVVAWMLHDSDDATERTAPHGSAWEDYPFLRCDGPELRGLLYPDEQYLSPMSSDAHRHDCFVEPSALRRSKNFYQILRGIAAKGGPTNLARLSPLEKQAVELKNRLMLFDRIRSGIVDGGDDAEMKAASAALREAYHSGSLDLLSAALADFVGASRGALHMDDEAAKNRLACEDWFNAHHPFHQARLLSMLAAGLLTGTVLVGVRRPAWRRGFLASGLLACVGCLGWSAAGFRGRAILHDGALVSDGSEVLLWTASLAMGLGFVLGLLYRDAIIALVGSLVSTIGFVLVERWPPAFTAAWPTLPNILAGDAWLSWQVLATVSAYAALTLAWGLAALALVRVALVPPSGERLRSLATLCARLIGIGLVFLAVGALLGAFRATTAGNSWRGWDVTALGAFFALPCCVFLLYARRVGWLQPFGLMVAAVLGFTSIVLAWHVLCRGAWDWHTVFDLAADAWLYGVCLANLCLIVHAALRYYFGKQRAIPI